MNATQEQVKAAINATQFLSASKILWFGVPAVVGLPRRVKVHLTPQQARAYVLGTLQDCLYQNFYCRGFAAPGSPDLDSSSSRAREESLVQELSAANSGAGYLTPGWELRRIENGEFVLFRNGLELRIPPENCETPRDRHVPGLRVGVRFPKEFPNRLPGFYVAMGNNAWDAGEERLLRLYWNVTPDGAVCLMRSATLMLNSAGVPFQLKVYTNPERFRRCDAAVLYLRREDYARVSGILEQIYADASAHIIASIPVFSKSLAPGVGLAESPGQGMSFGQHRCHLLAEGMLRAYEAGKTSVSDRCDGILDHFRDHGIDLARAPHLNPGSEDGYHPWPRDRRWTNRDDSPVAARRDVPPGELLNTAIRVGHRICRDAVWSGNRCNWMGFEYESAHGFIYKALGPALYGGATGVALFLAELYGVTGDATVAAAAVGAIRQALSQADGIEPTDRLGLFSGWTGLALAAARAGTCLAEEDLLEQARHFLRRVAAEPPAGRPFDLISGAAGAIGALLTLREVLSGDGCLDASIRLGDCLIERADKAKEHWSWKNARAPRERNLTGFSHGTAGIGYALLELFRATGEGRYRSAAEQAFQYERDWFDAGSNNWPDFRGIAARRIRRNQALPCSVAWCHGAAGIALSRLRAHEITGAPQYKAEALTALRTTREATRGALRAGDMGFSLCHGLGGNAEVLSLGARMFGQEFHDGTEVALTVAAAGIDRYGAEAEGWFRGAVASTPGLMVGLAGVGYFYLRLYDPGIPSALLLMPGSFGERASSARLLAPSV